MHFFDIHRISVLLLVTVSAVASVLENPSNFDIASVQDNHGKPLHRVIRRAKYKLRLSDNTYKLELKENDESKAQPKEGQTEDDDQAGRRLTQYNLKHNSQLLRNSFRHKYQKKKKHGRNSLKPDDKEKDEFSSSEESWDGEDIPNSNEETITEPYQSDASTEKSISEPQAGESKTQPLSLSENKLDVPLSLDTTSEIPSTTNTTTEALSDPPLPITESTSNEQLLTTERPSLVPETVTEDPLSTTQATIEGPGLAEKVDEGPVLTAQATTDEPMLLEIENGGPTTQGTTVEPVLTQMADEGPLSTTQATNEESILIDTGDDGQIKTTESINVSPSSVTEVSNQDSTQVDDSISEESLAQ